MLLDQKGVLQGFSREPRVFKSIYLNRVTILGQSARSFASRLGNVRFDVPFTSSSEAKSSTAKQDYERVVCCAGGFLWFLWFL